VMCATAQEMKQQNGTQTYDNDWKANVHEIAETYREAYPHAKIMYPGKEDFTHRKGNGFSEILKQRWDCVILTHDQFGMIPQSLELQRRSCKLNSTAWRIILPP
jgi:hypothetical protein